MIDIDTAMVSIKTGISLLTETIGLVQKTKEILPDADDKEAIAKSLNEALKATQIAEAKLQMHWGTVYVNAHFHYK